MNKIIIYLSKPIRRIVRFFYETNDFSAEYVDQEGNDLIAAALSETDNSGLMISKFGTNELSCINCVNALKKGVSFQSIYHHIKMDYSLDLDFQIYKMSYFAGFFPQNKESIFTYVESTLDDIKLIDILGSYKKEEKFLQQFMTNAKTVNLDGFYAPFLWENPWSKQLKGKKVLVVHPFVDSIRYQYEHNRELLFDNPDVLPKFKSLSTVKAVQSIGGEGNPNFHSWFDALNHMKNEIDSCDYEIAIIGCGAYGMNLAAHVKRQGKIAIHLAGWTQMLFGVYGNRWTTDQPKYSKFINKHWIRPNQDETPNVASNVENGCYW